MNAVLAPPCITLLDRKSNVERPVAHNTIPESSKVPNIWNRTGARKTRSAPAGCVLRACAGGSSSLRSPARIASHSPPLPPRVAALAAAAAGGVASDPPHSHHPPGFSAPAAAVGVW